MQETLPKASIVVATYNYAAKISPTIKGILEIEYPDEFEIIVVNDGSTDNTAEVLEKEFGKNKKVKIINFEKNRGVCAARNAGINAARFPIVVNMDHDCIPEKNWLTSLVKGFSSEKTGVVSSMGAFGGTSTAFRKEALEKTGGYDEQYRYYREDTDLTFKILELGYEYNVVKAGYLHDHVLVKPKGFFNILKYGLQRLSYHKNDALLYKKHPKLAKDFLDVRLGFIVNPKKDFEVITGTWMEHKIPKLSSPRGMVFLEGNSPRNRAVIVILGIGYVLAIKFYRLLGSIKYGKLLL
ncbi:MAG: glycosyltransferase family A protein [Candidatus ainarchaeum sp.]|nr:glycosyltransferase family A protein [Candidatus ainarchaeum sp.]